MLAACFAIRFMAWLTWEMPREHGYPFLPDIVWAMRIPVACRSSIQEQKRSWGSWEAWMRGWDALPQYQTGWLTQCHGPYILCTLVPFSCTLATQRRSCCKLSSINLVTIARRVPIQHHTSSNIQTTLEIPHNALLSHLKNTHQQTALCFHDMRS